jgi:uncharacterized protein (TIGR03118 family)
MVGRSFRRTENRRARVVLSLEPLEDRCLLSGNYVQTNFVSDVPGQGLAADPKLKNAWGLAAAPGGPWWVSDNNSGVATLYNSQGAQQSPTVTIPPAAGTAAAPTGIVANTTGAFDLAPGQPAVFLFATLNGTIAGWAPGVKATEAVTVVDNSRSPAPGVGAVYTGLTMGTDPAGRTLLYAANFRSGSVDVFDANFRPAALPAGLRDATVPAGYAPFNVQNVNGQLYVTYAKQDAARHDSVHQAGAGFVDVFSTDGRFLMRLGTRGALNAPWGVAMAPAGFGRFSNDVLVGNFGDGRVNAFDPGTGEFEGQLQDPRGNPLTVPGLWALRFGTGGQTGDPHALFFTSGPNRGRDGFFGSLTALNPHDAADPDAAGAAETDRASIKAAIANLDTILVNGLLNLAAQMQGVTDPTLVADVIQAAATVVTVFLNAESSLFQSLLTVDASPAALAAEGQPGIDAVAGDPSPFESIFNRAAQSL